MMTTTMTNAEIIRMAREAGFEADEANFIFKPKNNRMGIQLELERFAALVAAHEREACAKVCEEQIKSYMSKQYTTDPLGGYSEKFATEQCAEAIRARGLK